MDGVRKSENNVEVEESVADLVDVYEIVRGPRVCDVILRVELWGIVIMFPPALLTEKPQCSDVARSEDSSVYWKPSLEEAACRKYVLFAITPSHHLHSRKEILSFCWDILGGGGLSARSG